MVDDALRALADRLGVATEYWDWQGRHVEVPAATVVTVLGALGVDASDATAAGEALDGLWRREWARMLPPCVVTRAGRPTDVAVHATAGDVVRAWVDLEDGGARHDVAVTAAAEANRQLDGRWVSRTELTVPADLPLGLPPAAGAGGERRQRDRAGRHAGVARRARPVAPRPRLGARDPALQRAVGGVVGHRRPHRSRRSRDLGGRRPRRGVRAGQPAARGGTLAADGALAVPALDPPVREPALPAGRGRAGVRRARRGRAGRGGRLPRRGAGRRRRRRVPRAGPGVGGETAGAAGGLDAGRRPARQIAFDAYREHEGDGLTDFATWCALSDRHGPDFRTWPAELQHPGSDAVATFRDEHAAAVEFHVWLQWLLDEQLAGVQAATRRAGMPLGIVHDLAVGVSRTGADAWALQDVLARDVTVGAPPDAYNQVGQDWNQPPWRPDELASLSYAPFREMVSTVLRHAGGVRVDHVLGLFRLWWIPAGAAPTAGTYVRYDHEAMVGILTLEAYRAGALVVGEDLGTVEPWVRDVLRQRGILGTSVLWFEGDYGPGGTGGPLPAERWREYCLASVTTHDLPPTAAYLAGDHIRLRESLGLLTRPVAEEEADDHAARAAWFAELHRAGLVAADDDPAATVTSLHRYLLRTPSRLLVVSLTDAVGDARAQNQPGTDATQYPNWRIPLAGPDGTPMGLEAVFTDPRAAALLDAVREG